MYGKHAEILRNVLYKLVTSCGDGRWGLLHHLGVYAVEFQQLSIQEDIVWVTSCAPGEHCRLASSTSPLSQPTAPTKHLLCAQFAANVNGRPGGCPDTQCPQRLVNDNLQDEERVI